LGNRKLTQKMTKIKAVRHRWGKDNKSKTRRKKAVRL
jgi:hypothetical protein